MTVDERPMATPPGVVLGPIDLIAPGTARNFVLQLRKGRFHGFVVRHGRGVTGYVDACPHRGLPLAKRLDDYLAPGGALLMCSWHGALFEIDSGRCTAGPCPGARLTRWPVEIVDGMIVTAAAP